MEKLSIGGKISKNSTFLGSQRLPPFKKRPFQPVKGVRGVFLPWETQEMPKMGVFGVFDPRLPVGGVSISQLGYTTPVLTAF